MSKHAAGMHNDEGKNVELYIPRKCSATNRIIGAKDHAAIQVNIGHVNASGVYNGNYTTVAFCGFLRLHAMSDAALNRIAAEQKLMKNLSAFPTEDKFTHSRSGKH